MMTKLEQEYRTAEALISCLPRIATALESIAKSLEAQCRNATREARIDSYKVSVSGLKPESDHV